MAEGNTHQVKTSTGFTAITDHQNSTEITHSSELIYGILSDV